MGFIAAMARSKGIALNSGYGEPSHPADPGRSRAIWREIFGATSKEDDHASPTTQNTSVTAEGAAFKRLLTAMRSRSPGGWSDDRWEQSRHFTGITYVGIDRIARQMGRSTFQVYRKDESSAEGKRLVTKYDPPEGERQCRPYDLVRILEHPNNQDSFGQMMYRLYQQKGLTGTALLWMVPNALPTPAPFELYPIPTALAIPQPVMNSKYPNGFYRIQPVYPYGPFSSYPVPSSAVGAPIPAEWMLRFQNPHPLLRYDGYSPLSAMRLEIDEFESIGRSRWYKMKRSTNPSAVLNMSDFEGAQPLPEAELDRIHAEFENEHQGPENHGRLIITPPGGRLDEFGSKAVDMDYPMGWEQLAGFVLSGGFGITKPAAGMVDDSSYSTLFATIKQLYLLTVEPECDSIAASLTKHLAPFFGDDLFVEIKPKRIDDHDILFQKITSGVQARAITKNQVLKMLELPTTDEEWGNDIAGDPSPAEREQQAQELAVQQQAENRRMARVAADVSLENNSDGIQSNPRNPDEARAEPAAVGNLRPHPENMESGGSRGPNKSMRKSMKRLDLADLLKGRNGLRNGNGKH